MTLFSNIELEFDQAKKDMEKKDGGFWKPIVSDIGSIEDLIVTLSRHTIKWCIGRHRNEDFGINPPKLGGASFDARCIDSVNNAACAHNTRLRHLLDLGWKTLGISYEEHRWSGGTLETYDLLEKSIHLARSNGTRNFYQQEFGRTVETEILEVKTALEIALKSRVKKG